MKKFIDDVDTLLEQSLRGFALAHAHAGCVQLHLEPTYLVRREPKPAGRVALVSGGGILFIVKNYSGDTMNFQMASEMLDIEHLTVTVDDDVAVENSTHTIGRRGVAGTVVVEKLVGAAAEAGASQAECKRLGDRANARTASMGVAFSSCTVPAAGVPTFEIGPGEIEMAGASLTLTPQDDDLRQMWDAPVHTAVLKW